MQSDRRRELRIPVNRELESLDVGTFNYVREMSPMGVFLCTRAEIAIGTELRLRFSVLVDDVVVIECTGRAVRFVDGEHPGYGLQFVHVDPANAKLVRQCLAHLRLKNAWERGERVRRETWSAMCERTDECQRQAALTHTLASELEGRLGLGAVIRPTSRATVSAPRPAQRGKPSAGALSAGYSAYSPPAEANPGADLPTRQRASARARQSQTNARRPASNSRRVQAQSPNNHRPLASVEELPAGKPATGDDARTQSARPGAILARRGEVSPRVSRAQANPTPSRTVVDLRVPSIIRVGAQPECGLASADEPADRDGRRERGDTRDLRGAVMRSSPPRELDTRPSEGGLGRLHGQRRESRARLSSSGSLLHEDVPVRRPTNDRVSDTRAVVVAPPPPPASPSGARGDEAPIRSRPPPPVPGSATGKTGGPSAGQSDAAPELRGGGAQAGVDTGASRDLTSKVPRRVSARPDARITGEQRRVESPLSTRDAVSGAEVDDDEVTRVFYYPGAVSEAVLATGRADGTVRRTRAASSGTEDSGEARLS